MSWSSRSASVVLAQKVQTVTMASYSAPVLFYFLWFFLSWKTLTARCRISISVTVTQPLLAIDLYSSAFYLTSPLDGSSRTHPCISFFIGVSSGMKLERTLPAPVLLSPYLICYLVLCTQERHSLVFSFLFLASKNVYCCTWSSKSQQLCTWCGADCSKDQAELYLNRELILSMGIFLPIFIRLYQQQLKQAGIYCQIAWTNNLISHCLKNDPHLSRLCN